MGSIVVPNKFQLFNTQQTKKMAVVVKIAGLSDILSNTTIKTRIVYGDGDIRYGDPGLVYGGLRNWVKTDGSTFQPILSLDASSLTLTQTLDPEQGKASVSTLSLGFVDKDGYMTKLISPGVKITEILGAEVEVFLGYEEIAYPDDYLRIFRGYVSQVQAASGVVTLQLSDPNIKRRQELFFIAKTKLSAGISAVSSSLPVVANGDFFDPIIGSDGGYDAGIKVYAKIDDEYIEHTPFNPAVDGTHLTVATRGARGTTAASHSINADVSAAIEILGSPIDIALKLMLSGWGGSPWTKGIQVLSIGPNPDPDPSVNTTDYIVLMPKVDAKRDYGLVEGDWVWLANCVNPSNNAPGIIAPIVRFADLDGQSNRIIYVNSAYSYLKEPTTTATVGFASKYDKYPPGAGLKLTPRDVDVERHEYYKNTFQSIGETQLQFFITDVEATGKDFIETQVYRPVGLYSLTRRGLLSVGMTKPPLADETLQFVSEDNILNATELRPIRTLNNRMFYNEVHYYMDYSDAGNSTSITQIVDSDSLNNIGISSVLKIESRGTRSTLSSATALDKIAQFILSRYKTGAVTISPKVNWQVGCMIEAGDVVALDDNGTLKLANFSDGTRNLGIKLFEVVERALDIKSGNVTLKLVSGIGAEVTDRFATIAPSSKVSTGSTTTSIVIKDSYEIIYPGNEKKKWEQYVGLPILVHNDDWTVSEETTFLGFDPTNDYAMQVSPALSFTPAADYIVDIANFPNTSDKSQSQTYKVIHAFLDPTVLVATGVNVTNFTVAPADISKFFVNQLIRVHSEDYVRDSGEMKVSAVNTGTNTVTVLSTMGFTPSAADQIDLIGFPDGSYAYRWI